jgi:hypothetical protein
MTAITEIQAERQRQIEVEGWTPEHDDKHDNGELADAATCYACPSTRSLIWPWDEQWWKPTTRRRDLIKAAALIVAEIERLDRLPPHPKDGKIVPPTAVDTGGQTIEAYYGLSKQIGRRVNRPSQYALWRKQGW